ncbi:MAG: hypothetical protein PHR07_08795 [Acidaminococcaceae bacterium]|nr:hypothetical protein [Acidaminococcaceae bacterium]
MLKKTMPKLMAVLVLVGFMGSASLPIVAEAAFQHSKNVHEQRILHPKEEQRLKQHIEKQDNYHDNLKDREDNEDHDNHNHKQVGAGH